MKLWLMCIYFVAIHFVALVFFLNIEPNKTQTNYKELRTKHGVINTAVLINTPDGLTWYYIKKSKQFARLQ